MFAAWALWNVMSRILLKHPVRYHRRIVQSRHNPQMTNKNSNDQSNKMYYVQLVQDTDTFFFPLLNLSEADKEQTEKSRFCPESQLVWLMTGVSSSLKGESLEPKEAMMQQINQCVGWVCCQWNYVVCMSKTKRIICKVRKSLCYRKTCISIAQCWTAGSDDSVWTTI